eukprot:CAMPEP_0204072004 /NCGR_PEP_ID=MMETSP0360-20130528/161021_1 /ASSEMBLY_ACC=CAM_ASM_000342 /TAXON_ID=268821 /ORGANISM="Scrippsiella Hangoei, Strain SHTV-5" /LENGTH=169 /DNA_ID=CAMNT_0051020315 /DNA_START=20 /DNA_END=525 /DNA_ORIENTATION=+
MVGRLLWNGPAVAALGHEDLHLLAQLAPADGAVRHALLRAALGAEREVLARQADDVCKIIHADDASAVLRRLRVLPTLALGLHLALELHVLGIQGVLQHQHRVELLVETAHLHAAALARRQLAVLHLLVKCLVLDVLPLQALNALLQALAMLLEPVLAAPEVLHVPPQV